MSNNLILREGEVLSVEDDKGGLRIKTRLLPDDKGKNLNELPYAFPLLPKNIRINPKKGEMVLIIVNDTDSPGKRRWFIGPVISQDYYMNECSYLTQAKSLLDDGDLLTELPKENPKLFPEYNGTLPDREDIAIVGRQNSDIILKDNELRIRCGFKQTPDLATRSLIFNDKNLSYIQMKYKRMLDNNNNDFSSSINIVADKINLLSHQSKTPFTLNDRKDLITDDELKKILEKAHPLPYGDELVKFLEKFRELFISHTHPYSMLTPCTPQNLIDFANINLNKLLSDSIRIN